MNATQNLVGPVSSGTDRAGGGASPGGPQPHNEELMISVLTDVESLPACDVAHIVRESALLRELHVLVWNAGKEAPFWSTKVADYVAARRKGAPPPGPGVDDLVFCEDAKLTDEKARERLTWLLVNKEALDKWLGLRKALEATQALADAPRKPPGPPARPEEVGQRKAERARCICAKDLFSPGAEAACAWDKTSASQGGGAPVTVCFPLLGEVVSHDELRFGPQELVAQLERRPPSWLFHLRIAPTAGEWSSHLPGLSCARLRRLADRLQLQTLRRGGYSLEPLEMLQGPLPAPEERSPYAFGFPECAFAPDASYELAVACGLVAAATGRPLPSWAVCSGDFFEASLELKPTEGLTEKCQLALGARGGETISTLVQRLYESPCTAKHLGRLEDRALPGKVRLLIVSSVTGPPLEALSPTLAAERLDVGLGELGQEDLEALRLRVESLSGDGLLVVQVPTAREALLLLGHHHVHPLLGLAAGEAARPIRAYRVWREKVEPGPAYWGRYAQSKALALGSRLERSASPHARLLAVLQTCQEAIRDLPEERACCDAVYVRAAGPDPGWSRLVAAAGPRCAKLPFLVPSDLGAGPAARQGGEPFVLDRRRAKASDWVALAGGREFLARYGVKEAEKYGALLSSVRSFVLLPLLSGPHWLGSLCLHLRLEGEAPPELVEVLRELAGRATAELAYWLGEQGQSVALPQRGESAEAPADSPLELLPARWQQYVARRCPAAALEELARELAEQARQRVGAFRTVVRFITPDRRGLVVLGHAGPPGAWPEPFLARTISLHEDAAATFALETGKSYYLEDTAQAYVWEAGKWCPVHYQPISPEARGHASVLLRQGGHLLGVLSVDWERPGSIPPGARQGLEELAGQYALAFKAFGVEALSAVVDDLVASLGLEEGGEAGLASAYRRFLHAVAQMVGARQGAIFLRRAETGLYHLAASMLHPEWGPERWYAPGEGLTGWVAKHNRPLRIANLSDRAELCAIDPLSPPVWKDKWFDGEAREDRNLTYLAVPVAVGNEVLGVLRLASGVGRGESKGGFGDYDQQIALAAAARLAGALYQHRQARHTAALTRLAACLVRAKSHRGLGKRAFEAVERGVGPCACWARIVDEVDLGEEGPVEVLAHSLASDPAWGGLRAPLARRKGEGIAGRVWQSQRMLVLDHASFAEASRAPLVEAILKEEPANRELLEAFHSLACLPLRARGRFLGTLLVCRRAHGGLTPGDLSFLQAVADMTSQALETVARSEERSLETKLLWAFHRARPDGPRSPGLEPRALASTNKALVRELRAEAGCVWALEGAKFCCVHADGVERAAVPDLPAERVARALGGKPFVVVIDPVIDRRLADLLPPSGAGLAECQQVAIRVAVRERPVALFLLLLAPGEPVRHNRFARLVRTLSELTSPHPAARTGR